MTRHRPSRRRQQAPERGPYLLAAAGVALLVAILGGYGWLQYMHVDTDRATSCPRAGLLSVTAVILDVTDKLGPIQQADLRAFMEEVRDQVPKYGRLDLYTVGTVEQRPLEIQFSSCNPGSARDVGSSLTGNAALADRAWRQRFADKLQSVLTKIVASTAEDTSPILESIQSVSVTSFEDAGARQAEKRIILVSDLLQYTKRASFYKGAPDFEAFKGTQYYREIRTELGGVNVTVSIIPRETKRSAQDRKLLTFWTAYFADEGAIVDRWRPIKGGES